MFIITAIENNKLVAQEVFLTLDNAYRMFKHCIRKKISAKEAKEAFIQREYHDMTTSVYIRYFQAGKDNKRKKVFFKSEYITHRQYLYRIGLSYKNIRDSALRNNISVWDYMERVGLIKNEKAMFDANTLDQWVTRYLPRRSRLRTKLESLDQKQDYIAPPIKIPESEYVSDIPF